MLVGQIRNMSRQNLCRRFNWFQFWFLLLQIQNLYFKHIKWTENLYFVVLYFSTKMFYITVFILLFLRRIADILLNMYSDPYQYISSQRGALKSITSNLRITLIFSNILINLQRNGGNWWASSAPSTGKLSHSLYGLAANRHYNHYPNVLVGVFLPWRCRSFYAASSFQLASATYDDWHDIPVRKLYVNLWF